MAPQADPRMVTTMFTRNSDQNKMIGLSEENNEKSIIKPLGTFDDVSINNTTDEVVQFNNPCPNCKAICETNMKVTGNIFSFFNKLKLCNSIHIIFLKFFINTIF